MRFFFRTVLLTGLLWGVVNCVNAQMALVSFDALHPAAAVPQYATISSINITGNKRTRPEIILRELDFKEGDTIALSELAERIERNELNLMNTGLFLQANIWYDGWEGATNNISLHVGVLEGMFIVPFPILELADRNFNVWWETYNHSLRRLNWGVRFLHANLTGRKDPLKAVVQMGFTKKFEIIYTLPFFNKYKTLGANINWLHTREKEIGYTTENDMLLFHRGDEILLKRFRLGLGLRLRPHYDAYHALDISWHRNEVASVVLNELNPEFFTKGTTQRFATVNYEFTYDKRDIKPYPLSGYFFETQVKAQGLGMSEDINTLELMVTYMQYFRLAPRWSIEMGVRGKTELLRNKVPYYNSVALGYYLDYIKGYEFYVIDGTDYAWQKSTLRFGLLDRSFDLSKYMPYEAFKLMPLKVYLALHNELAYVNNPWYGVGNPMANQLLWGLSLGLDFQLYYNKVFSIELSRNHLNEYGFYLHWSLAF
ncbi:MAG: hypothetical protein CMN32_12590 [Saprospirales bacterium]|nr:hypothetical protein [Saprospirales bacterium]